MLFLLLMGLSVLATSQALSKPSPPLPSNFPPTTSLTRSPLTQHLAGIPTSTTTEPQPTLPPSVVAPTSYTYPYTVTTPTTAYRAPTFQTSAPIPSCAGTIAAMCPSLEGQTCVDALGQKYGILCRTRFSGIVITTSGKKFLMEREEDFEGLMRRDVEEGEEGEGADGKGEFEEVGVLERRDYQGNFTNCVGSCDGYAADTCVGVYYEHGYCMAYDMVTGTFNSPYGMAALRQS
ncbi:hypothetical protein B0A50_03299 [Salinomyces thailandicus]|uniref:Uncharacterized protein n=1 Tax=Salinomyces thailandicus TaxID=706561 RepID=A0A4U0U1Z9_9PEZI|nr:hypothetical protein B0A50_03299 [Salinomyces thailandica]